MSTICKLEPNVRLDRYLRKQQRVDMSKDLKTARDLIKRGEHQLKLEGIISKDPKFSEKTRNLLTDLRLKAAVLTLTLKHITGICKDPRRTGAAKEAILSKLGAEPEAQAA